MGYFILIIGPLHSKMYPAELEIKDTKERNTSASYLDLLLSIESDGQLRTSLYDKRDDFYFHITNWLVVNGATRNAQCATDNLSVILCGLLNAM